VDFFNPSESDFLLRECKFGEFREQSDRIKKLASEPGPEDDLKMQRVVEMYQFNPRAPAYYSKVNDTHLDDPRFKPYAKNAYKGGHFGRSDTVISDRDSHHWDYRQRKYPKKVIENKIKTKKEFTKEKYACFGAKFQSTPQSGASQCGASQSGASQNPMFDYDEVWPDATTALTSEKHS